MADETSAGTRHAILDNTQAWIGDDRIGVSGALSVRRDDGTVERRALLHLPDQRREVVAGDEVTIDGRTWRVGFDLDRPGLVLEAE